MNEFQKHNLKLEESLAGWDKEQLTRALRLLCQSNALLCDSSDEVTLLKEYCRLLVNEGGYLMAWIGEVVHDAEKSVRPMAESGYEAGYLSEITLSWDEESPYGQGPCGMAIRSGQSVVNPNAIDNPMVRPWRQAALQRGYQSSVSIPLVAHQEVTGVLNLYAIDASTFTAHEVFLLETLARSLACRMAMFRQMA